MLNRIIHSLEENQCLRLLPWHLGGVYAYLANDLTIGAMVAVGFYILVNLGE